VLEPGDTFESHIEDTMIAGAGLNNRATVEFVVEHAPAAIARLAELGVPFNIDTDGEGWHLTREGGHSHRRIVHVDDATGWAVQQALEKAADAHPNISLVPDMVAIDLVTSRHGERYSGDGHVWGVKGQNLYPGMTLVPASAETKRWADALGIPFREATIETNEHNLSLVFSDLIVDRVRPGHVPFVVVDRGPHARTVS